MLIYVNQEGSPRQPLTYIYVSVFAVGVLRALQLAATLISTRHPELATPRSLSIDRQRSRSKAVNGSCGDGAASSADSFLAADADSFSALGGEYVRVASVGVAPA